jgi:M6 family metalloprotease-like protein
MTPKFILQIMFIIWAYNGYAQTDIGFICGTDSNSVLSRQQIGTLTNTTWTLKILLVEFADVKHRNPADHNKPAYTFGDWDDLFFSNGEYVSPNMYCPDGKKVYGSMRDYFQIISDGEFTLTGYVVNRDDNSDNIPDWIALPNTKAHYGNQSIGGFDDAAKSAAIAAGLDVSTNSTTKLAVIYAGHTYRKKPNGQPGLSGLNPYAERWNNVYIMGELFAPYSPYNTERPDAIFSGIGINAHEFGHLLGWDDNEDGWGLMSGGPYYPRTNADNNKWCSAPLPPGPYNRSQRGWVSFVPITSDVTFYADYNMQDPEIFQIKNSSNPSDYYLVECRHAHGTMTIGSTQTVDYNSWIPWDECDTFSGQKDVWLNVWHFNTLIQADGFNYSGHAGNYCDSEDNKSAQGIDGGDGFPGRWDVKVLSPWSFPQNLRNNNSPTTYPTANVGFEVVSVNTNNILVDFYYNDPEDASPAQPRFLTATNITDAILLTWEANNEPDLAGYEVYRKINSGSIQKISGNNLVTTNSYVDGGLQIVNNSVTEHTYYVKAVDNDNKKSTYSIPVTVDVEYVSQGGAKRTADDSEIPEVPTHFALEQNYPNPFNPTTTFAFALPESAPVRLTIFDLNGRQVAELINEELPAGRYEIPFDASGLASGVYLYRLSAGSFTQTRKMMLMK